MTDDVDVLGPGWTARTLPLRPDGGTPDPVATLVHREGSDSTASRRSLLYVHGFVDYFFHTQFADTLAAHGYDVYALDLRDYGRSIRDGRPPNHITDLGTYAEEIDAAIRAIRADHDEIVLLGHSMGGLVTSLWADARRGTGLIDALVLNSPWLDLRGSWFERTVFTAVLKGVGKIAPGVVVGKVGPFYGRALHEGTGGEWSYDLAWKPLDGFPARAGFARAVRRGHARVARGLAVDVPVLLLASDASGPDDAWHDALVTTDSVLDVADMKRLAPNLGPDVTFVEIPGGAHDLALSPAPARDTYVAEVLAFLDARLP
ncbi:alpha/beta hydrolase [Cellulomonas sp. Leaf334]|uniref:alpha/beta hydrolase n=1 Tax=Cellulomonas sp. Leaf334 TaxID=1736339 RepID=UPI0006F26735|nr:alpha/beta hydrolase [Cellulomonas sp. Leaf334]KQR11859.1 alpha/beta hydrolase [Cellulomonas sp. Leaf334]